MSKWDKLLSRILSLDNELRFQELKKVLEYYGYEMNSPRGGSSHCTFRKKGKLPITVPRHEPIKKVYHFGKSTTPDQLDQTWVNCLNLFGVEYNA